MYFDRYEIGQNIGVDKTNLISSRLLVRVELQFFHFNLIYIKLLKCMSKIRINVTLSMTSISTKLEKFWELWEHRRWYIIQVKLIQITANKFGEQKKERKLKNEQVLYKVFLRIFLIVNILKLKQKQQINRIY